VTGGLVRVIPLTVRAVVFDAVGTVIFPDPPATVVYAEVAKRLDSRVAPDEIPARFRRAFARQEEIDCLAGLRTSEEREVQRWRQIVSQVLDDVADTEACFRELFDHFSDPRAWRCDAEIGVVLAELASRGYALGLASNYDRRLRRVVSGLPMLTRLERLIISSEVGWRKPAPEFFTAVTETFGSPQSRILYVGDDLANDYEGALSAGMHGVLYDPRCAGPAGASRITRLTDLL
jgi:putative hydrolase of the HAD superfamily